MRHCGDAHGQWSAHQPTVVHGNDVVDPFEQADELCTDFAREPRDVRIGTLAANARQERGHRCYIADAGKSNEQDALGAHCSATSIGSRDARTWATWASRGDATRRAM